MTLEEAIQEFEDFCYHHSLHPEISNEALVNVYPWSSKEEEEEAEE